MDKPVVHYTPIKGEQIQKGSGALIYGVRDHPHISPFASYVITTVVERVFDDGSFETRNTIYKPING